MERRNPPESKAVRTCVGKSTKQALPPKPGDNEDIREGSGDVQYSSAERQTGLKSGHQAWLDLAKQ